MIDAGKLTIGIAPIASHINRNQLPRRQLTTAGTCQRQDFRAGLGGLTALVRPTRGQ